MFTWVDASFRIIWRHHSASRDASYRLFLVHFDACYRLEILSALALSVAPCVAFLFPIALTSARSGFREGRTVQQPTINPNFENFWAYCSYASL